MPTETNGNGKVLLRVRPRGFCAGVVRAVDIVELALEAYGAPVYVHHEIVHNTYVVEQLRRRGAIFVESIEDQWHGTNALYFRIRADDGNIYVLGYDEADDIWTVKSLRPNDLS